MKSTYLGVKKCVKRGVYMSKETYGHEKRPVNIKKDVCTFKETYGHEKRPMKEMCQERSINDERDLWT